HSRQEPEPALRRALSEDRLDGGGAAQRRQIRLCGDAGRDRRKRHQPEHPALRRYLRGGGRNRRRRRAARNRATGTGARRRPRPHARAPQGAGRGGGLMAGELILYTTEDGAASVRLRAEGGSVWITQAEMA